MSRELSRLDNFKCDPIHPTNKLYQNPKAYKLSNYTIEEVVRLRELIGNSFSKIKKLEGNDHKQINFDTHEIENIQQKLAEIGSDEAKMLSAKLPAINPLFKVKVGQFTFDNEIQEHNNSTSRNPHVPGLTSGVTIGAGFDMKEKEAATVKAYFKKVSIGDENEQQAYINSIKLEGRAACNYIHANTDKFTEIEPQQQKDLFVPLYITHYQTEVVRLAYLFIVEGKSDYKKMIDWMNLDDKLFEILVDLHYQGLFARSKEILINTLLSNNLEEFKAKLDHFLTTDTRARDFLSRKQARMEHVGLAKQIYKTDPNDTDPLKVAMGQFTFDAEGDGVNDTTLPRVVHDTTLSTGEKYNIIIGRGYSLRKRRYFFGLPINVNSKTNIEIEAFLRAAGFGETLIEKYTYLSKLNEVQARAYINEHKDSLNITLEQQKKLFEVDYSHHVYEILRLSSWVKMHETYGLTDWLNLNQKIKDIVIDLSFTGHYNSKTSEIRKFLQPPIIADSLANFINALKDPNTWTVAQVNINSVWIDGSWKGRFGKRIEYLENNAAEEPREERIPLIHGDSGSLPLVEPAMCAPDEPAGLPGFGLKDNIIQCLRMPDGTITDICFPVEDAGGLIRGAGQTVEEVETDTIDVISSEEQMARVKKGMRLRYEEINGSYQYKEIVDVIRLTKSDHTTLDPINFKIKLVEPLQLHLVKNANFQIDSCYLLPLNKVNLANLLGEGYPGAAISIESPMNRLADIQKYIKVEPQGFMEAGQRYTINFPVLLNIHVPKLTSPGVFEYQKIRFYLNLTVERLSFNQWRLKENKLYMYLPEQTHETLIDFGIFSLEIPARAIPSDNPIPNQEHFDVCLNLEKREFIFKFSTIKKNSIKLYFPGGLSHDGRETLDSSLAQAKLKRFVCQLQEMEDAQDSSQTFLVRLNKQGISLHAFVISSEVMVEEDIQGAELVKPVKLNPQESNSQAKSEIIIVNNVIRKAMIAAKLQVPGFKDLVADVEVSLQKENPKQIPAFVVKLALSQNDPLPIAELNFAMLQMQFETNCLKMKLTWQDHGWDFSAAVDGQISFTPHANLLPDLEELRKSSAIKVEDLDLRKLNLKEIKSLALKLKEPIKFNILDGLFGCEFNDLTWSLSGGVAQITCESTKFYFNKPETLAVSIETGKFIVNVKNQMANISIPSPIKITVRIGSAVEFSGEFGWIEKPHERYLFAKGSVRLEGFPQVSALLKFGSLIKENGEKAINLVLYGATSVDMELEPGVVVKNIGAGVGINNRLTGIDSTPTANEILANIDVIKPDEIKGWSSVRENGLYISIVGSLILASQRGAANKACAYVAELILGLDTNLNPIAAGRLWLFSSVSFAMANRDSPVLMGGLTLSMREHKLSVALETHPHPKIEENKQLQNALERAHLSLSFTLTPQLVDYYIKDISYRDEFFDVNMLFSGSYRVALYRRNTFLAYNLRIEGNYRNAFEIGNGGFSFNGKLDISVLFQGLFGRTGLIIFGSIDAKVDFRVSAFIRVGVTVGWGRWKRTISKKFSIHCGTNLAFQGKAAIINGKSGFDGIVSISILICGHRLSLSPRLKIAPNVVAIARQEIAVFESQLDEAISQVKSSLQESLYGKGIKNLTSTYKLQRDRQESWLYYYNNKTMQHLLVPTHNSNWYVPEYPLAFGSEAERVNEQLRIKLKSDQSTVNVGETIFIHYLHNNQAAKIIVEDYYVVSEATGDSFFINYSNVPVNTYEVVWQRANNNFFPEFVNDVQLMVVGQLANNTIQINEIIEVDKKANSITVKAEGIDAKMQDKPIVLTGDCQGVWFVKQVGDVIKLHAFNHKQQMPTAITEHQLPTGFIPKVVLYTFWNLAARQYFNKVENIEQLGEGMSYFFETSQLAQPKKNKSYPKPKIVTDPRVVLLTRDFIDLDDQLLPEHVLSYDFRSLKELVGDSSITLKREIVKQIRDYEYAHERVNHLKHYEVDDRPVDEELQQSRAKLVNLIVNDLQRDEGPQIFGELAKKDKLPDDTSPLEVLGLIFHYPDKLLNASSDELYIQRSASKLEKVNYSKPDEMVVSERNLNKKIERLPIRQKFIAGEKTVAAKLNVKLPIKIDEELLIDASQRSQLGRFQIFRRLPGDVEALLIADNVYPDIQEFKEELELYYGEQIELSLTQSNYQFTLSLSWEQETIFSTADAFKVSFSSGQQYDIHETEYSPSSNFKDAEVTFKFTGNDTLPNKISLLVSAIHNKIIVNPYLYTDELLYQSGRFFQKQIGAEANEILPLPLDITPDSSEIYYAMRAVPVGLNESDNDNETSLLAEWLPVKLHVPAKDDFLNNLSVLFTVDNLVLADGEPIRFQLFNRDKREIENLALDQFELWAKEMPLRQTGFYGGAADAFTVKTGRDKASLNSKKLINRESTDGKFAITFKHLANDAPCCSYLINEPTQFFRHDCGYQFYIRPKHKTAELLYPMQHCLVRNLDNVSKQRYVDQIEWIDKAVYNNICSFNLEALLPSQYFVTSKYYDRENYLYFDFTVGDLKAGGIEAIIIDQDEPQHFALQTCEILEEEIFKTHQLDFRDSALWDLSPSSKKPIDKLTKGDSGKNYDHRLYFDYEAGESALIVNLKAAIQLIYRFAQDRLSQNKSYDWKLDLFPICVGFFTSLAAFINSPLNIKTPELLQCIEEINKNLANLFIGADVAVSIKEINEWLANLEEKIDKQQKAVTSSDNLLDCNLARQLLGILYRRVACVNDLFNLTNVWQIPNNKSISSKIVSGKSFIEVKEIRPGEHEWQRILRANHVSARENLVLTSEVQAKFSATTAMLSSSVAALETFENYLKDKKSGYSEKLASVVLTSRKLTELLDSFSYREESANGRKQLKLIKHPHHQVMTQADENGMVKPKATDLLTLLPDAAYIHQALNQLDINAKQSTNEPFIELVPSRAIIAYFNLMEYLGFAIDISATNELEQTVGQETLITRIKALFDQQFTTANNEYYVFVVKAVAANAISENENPYGYAFVKLAVIPKILHYSFVTNSHINSWLEPRGLLSTTISDAYKKLLQAVAIYIDLLISTEDRITEITVEESNKRWLTLPLIANHTYSYWQVPDHYGHRYCIALRKISRYEPLVCWQQGIKSTTLTNAQRLSNISFWKDVNTRPVFPAGLPLQEQNLTVYNYPDPTCVQFTYQLPSEAIRSLKNQIALIRTGYKGQNLAFRYELINNERVPMMEVLNKFKDRGKHERLPPFEVTMLTPDTAKNIIRLTDHERLVELAYLPFYYRYYLSCRVLYDTQERIAPNAFLQQTKAITVNNQHVKDITLQADKKILAKLPALPWLLELKKESTSLAIEISKISINEENIQLTFNRSLLIEPGEWQCYVYKTPETPAKIMPSKLGTFKSFVKGENGYSIKLLQLESLPTSYALLNYSNEEAGLLKELLGASFPKIQGLDTTNDQYKNVLFNKEEVEQIKEALEQISSTDAVNLSTKLILPKIEGLEQTPTLIKIKDQQQFYYMFGFKHGSWQLTALIDHNNYFSGIDFDKPAIYVSNSVERDIFLLTKQCHSLEVDFQFTLYLSRNIDYLTEKQNLEQPAILLTRDSKNNPYHIHQLPDLLTDYAIYWRIEESDQQVGAYYMPVLTLRLPWSDEHGGIIGDDLESKYCPKITEISPYLRINPSSNDGVEPTKEAKVFIEKLALENEEAQYIYRVVFTLRVMAEHQEKGHFLDKNQFYLQGNRDGVFMLPCNIQALEEA